MFWDINSMYVSTYKERFPTGLGFKWILEENSDFLKKTLLTKKNISISSIEWISTIQQSSKFIDKQGKRCKIRYGWNSEECSIGPYSVDGLCRVDDQLYILEFNGCKFHQCQNCEIKQFENKNIEVCYIELNFNSVEF